MEVQQIEPTTETTVQTMFDRLKERGKCLGCETPNTEMTKNIRVGIVFLMCPKCGCVVTERSYRTRITDPDKKRMVQWVV